MAKLNIEERVANIEHHLFGFTYEEAEPIYASMMETIANMPQRTRIDYFEANKDLLAKLERVLGIEPLEYARRNWDK